jgi:Zn-dependent peptidase ImmA (M78 family)
MKYTVAKIRRAFGHKLIGSSHMEKVVCETLLIFPDKIIDHITKNCWFVGSFEDGTSFALRGDELEKDEFLIYLSDQLFLQSKKDIRYTIAHEVGHVVLGHKNSIREVQTKQEIKRQEKQAHEFAQKHLKKSS